MAFDASPGGITGVGVCATVGRFYPLRCGGGERHLHLLARALVAKGVDLAIVMPWQDDRWLRFELLDGNVPLYRHYCWGLRVKDGHRQRGLGRVGTPIYIAGLLRQLWDLRDRWTVVHAHQGTEHAFVSVLAAKLWGRRSVVTLWNSRQYADRLVLLRRRSRLLGPLMWRVILQADIFVAVSSDIAQELEVQRVPKERIVRIPFGIDPSRFSPIEPERKGRLRQELGLPEFGTLVVCATRLLRRQKGLDVLLAAWRRVVSDGGNPYLVLLGDGQDRSGLESEARELGLAERVVFTGWRENPETYLAACDLFVLASRSEGLPNALLEAMACGLPVVATQVSGSVDVVNDQVGYLVPVEDAEALAARLRHLIEAPDLRRRMGANARRLIETHYSIQRTAEQHIALYQELAGEIKP